MHLMPGSDEDAAGRPYCVTVESIMPRAPLYVGYAHTAEEADDLLEDVLLSLSGVFTGFAVEHEVFTIFTDTVLEMRALVLASPGPVKLHLSSYTDRAGTVAHQIVDIEGDFRLVRQLSTEDIVAFHHAVTTPAAVYH